MHLKPKPKPSRTSEVQSISATVALKPCRVWGFVTNHALKPNEDFQVPNIVQHPSKNKGLQGDPNLPQKVLERRIIKDSLKRLNPNPDPLKPQQLKLLQESIAP